MLCTLQNGSSKGAAPYRVYQKSLVNRYTNAHRKPKPLSERKGDHEVVEGARVT